MTVQIALVHNRYFEGHILIAKDTVPFTEKKKKHKMSTG